MNFFLSLSLFSIHTCLTMTGGYYVWLLSFDIRSIDDELNVSTL